MAGSRIATLAAALAVSFPAIAGAASVGGALIGADGAKLGEVSLAETASGVLLMRMSAAGLPAGIHGAHIHQTGTCDIADGFRSAGGHLAGGHQHGVMAGGGPHPGDLPNLHVGADGRLEIELFVPGVAIGGDGPSLLDADGSALVLHAGPDDYSSQPSGDSGGRIACAVLGGQ